jgi:hemerythrin-like domain-containing protein
MKSIELLLDDHKCIRRGIEVLDEMARRAKHGEKPNKKDLKDLVEFLDIFGDRLHQGREEVILFPALSRDHNHYSKVRSLIYDHERQDFLIQGLQESILASSMRDFVFCATRLVEILGQHLDEEETTLFPLANSVLSSTEDEHVAADLAGYDKSWQAQKLPALLRRLENLESKYLGPAHGKVQSFRKASGHPNRRTGKVPIAEDALTGPVKRRISPENNGE